MSPKPAVPSISSSPPLPLKEGTPERKRKLSAGRASPKQLLSSPKPFLLRFEIRNFAGLPHPKGSFVETRSIKILNRPWHLRVYPRGHWRSRDDKVLVSCFLTVSGDGEFIPPPSSASSTDQKTSSSQAGDDFEFSFRIRNWEMAPKRCRFRSDMAYGFMGHTREKILEKGLDEDGKLVIEVALKFLSKPMLQKHPQENNVWYPNKRQRRWKEGSPMTRQLFQSPEYTDLAFLVDKRVFRAHKCVLAVRARMLLELALPSVDDDDQDSNGPVQLPGVKEDSFQAFLDYVYTSDERRILHFLGDNPEVAKSLLVMADKFGATDLKLFMESVLADKFLSVANCCEMMILADSHWCALLKEAAVDRYCSDPMAALEGSIKGWKLLEESPRLLSELLVRSARTIGHGETKRKYSRHHPNNPVVGALRERLENAGLDLDGSKEMLIRRYKDHLRHRLRLVDTGRYTRRR